jgi:hypothetical protein
MGRDSPSSTPTLAKLCRMVWSVTPSSFATARMADQGLARLTMGRVFGAVVLFPDLPMKNHSQGRPRCRRGDHAPSPRAATAADAPGRVIVRASTRRRRR